MRLPSLRAWLRKLKREWWDEAVERRARQISEERMQLMDVWRPFDQRRVLTKNHERALVGWETIDIEAMQIIALELQRDMSTRGLISDGDKRDKHMWIALGTKIFIDTLLERKKAAETRYKKDEAKEEEKKSGPSAQTPITRRSIQDLYAGNFGNQL